jgi:hypothetical protein
MPRSTPKKHLGAMAQSAQKKNASLIASITDNSGETVFARIDANIGSYFRLTIHDGSTTTQLLGSPRGLFKQRRSQIRFATNDIVILSGMPGGASQVSEIIGLLDKASAQDLFKQGRIHKSVYTPLDPTGMTTAEEDIFDYGDQEVDINNI